MPRTEEVTLDIEREDVSLPGLAGLLRYKANLWKKVAMDMMDQDTMDEAGPKHPTGNYRPLSRAVRVLLDKFLSWTER